jgi:diamine N-acetyltransferase
MSVTPHPITLRPITPDNYRAVRDLRVLPGQRGYVAPNVDSMAEAYAHPGAVARAIQHGDDLVGFVLFQPVDADRPEAGCGIVRFMIDHRFQGRGLGREALRVAVDFAARDPATRTVRLSVVPENTRARRLYAAAGFVETGELDDGEVVMVHTVARPGQPLAARRPT